MIKLNHKPTAFRAFPLIVLNMRAKGIFSWNLVGALWLLLVGCGSMVQVTPTVQRIIIQQPDVEIFKLTGERRNKEVLGIAQMGDTMVTFAEVFMNIDTIEQYYYVIHEGREGWLYSGNGVFAKTEYEVLASVCDTKFNIPVHLDSIAWYRALEYIGHHSQMRLQSNSEILIENSSRGKKQGSEKDIVFTVRRSQYTHGIHYSVKAEGSFTNIHARRCALYIQTGKDERSFQGVHNILQRHNR